MGKSIIDFALDYYSNLRSISRNATLFLLGSFFLNMLFSVQMLIFNLYLRECGFSEVFIGRVLSSGAIGSMLFAIPCAVLVSRYAIKPLLLWSTLLAIVSYYFMITVETSSFILAAGFSVGALLSVIRVASAPIIMRNSTSKERTYVFSLNFANWMFAGIIGSYAGGYAHKWYESTIQSGPESYRFVLFGGMLLGLLALIPFAMMKAKPPSKDEKKFVLSMNLIRKQGKLLFKLSFPFFLVGTGAGLIIPFLNLYFRDVFDLSTERIGTYFAAVQATMIIGTMAGPVLAKRIGMVRTLVFTELASVPFMLLMAYSGNIPLVVMAFLCRGALMNMGQPIGTNFAMEMVPKETHALANSLTMIAWTASWALSTQLGGWVIESHGYTLSFLIAAGLYAASAVLYYYYFSRSEKRSEDGYSVIPGTQS